MAASKMLRRDYPLISIEGKEARNRALSSNSRLLKIRKVTTQEKGKKGVAEMVLAVSRRKWGDSGTSERRDKLLMESDDETSEKETTGGKKEVLCATSA